MTQTLAGHGAALGGAVTDTGLFDWSRWHNILASDRRPVRLSWTRLPKRVFEIDLEHCPNCGGELKVIATTLRRDPGRDRSGRPSTPRERQGLRALAAGDREDRHAPGLTGQGAARCAWPRIAAAGGQRLCRHVFVAVTRCPGLREPTPFPLSPAGLTRLYAEVLLRAQPSLATGCGALPGRHGGCWQRALVPARAGSRVRSSQPHARGHWRTAWPGDP